GIHCLRGSLRFAFRIPHSIFRTPSSPRRGAAIHGGTGPLSVAGASATARFIGQSHRGARREGAGEFAPSRKIARTNTDAEQPRRSRFGRIARGPVVWPASRPRNRGE